MAFHLALNGLAFLLDLNSMRHSNTEELVVDVAAADVDVQVKNHGL